MNDQIRKVPELSLLSFVNGDSTERAKFVDNFFIGLKDYGFIILEDHTVESSVMKKAYDAIERFFALDLDIKMKYDSGHNGQRGYTSFGREHAKDNPNPDLKEFWHVGCFLPENHHFKKYYQDNMWPSEVAGFKENLTILYRELIKTSVHLLDALGIALDLPESYFREMTNYGNSILRPIYYPPVVSGVTPGSIRAAAHEDINLITILMGATASGLELLDRDGSWLPVKTTEGQLVVDSGDMLSRIANEVIPATTHRVVNPSDSSSARYSMPFFVHPHPEAELSCIPSCVGEGEKYPSINSNDFLMERLTAIGLSQK